MCDLMYLHTYIVHTCIHAHTYIDACTNIDTNVLAYDADPLLSVCLYPIDEKLVIGWWCLAKFVFLQTSVTLGSFTHLVSPSPFRPNIQTLPRHR